MWPRSYQNNLLATIGLVLTHSSSDDQTLATAHNIGTKTILSATFLLHVKLSFRNNKTDHVRTVMIVKHNTAVSVERCYAGDDSVGLTLKSSSLGHL